MTTSEHDDDAREAAQHVADSAESWEHGAEKSTIRDHLDDGLAQAGVEVSEEEKEQLVEDIKSDDASPEVDQASADPS